MHRLPEKRTDDMVVVDLPDETVVYDLKRDKAYHLNRTAALVWRHCDGKTSKAEMHKILRQQLNTAAATELIDYALWQLEEANLLHQHRSNGLGVRLSRREFIIKAGLVGAAFLVPTVVSLIAPTAAQATHTPTCVDSCVGQPNCIHCPTGPCNKFCWNGSCLPKAQTGC